jgi:hypothetical protein
MYQPIYEVWEITDGREAGDLIVASARDYAEMPAKLRSRLRKVGETRSPSAETTALFRKALAADPEIHARDDCHVVEFSDPRRKTE